MAPLCALRSRAASGADFWGWHAITDVRKLKAQGCKPCASIRSRVGYDAAGMAEGGRVNQRFASSVSMIFATCPRASVE